MTQEERDLCLGLIISLPGTFRKISKEEFERRFPLGLDQGKVATRLFEEAAEAKNSDDVQCALIVGHAFGFAATANRVLARLLEAGWHVSHEDIVSALEKLRVPESIDALYWATQWIPEYLDYDDSRALAVKAIWALGKMPSSDAEFALRKLASSNEDVIRNNAIQQLERRKT